MPITPTPDNPRGYALVPNGESDITRATNAAIKEISQDVNTLSTSPVDFDALVEKLVRSGNDFVLISDTQTEPPSLKKIEINNLLAGLQSFATSTTSHSLAHGIKTFAVAQGITFLIGCPYVRISDGSDNHSHFMEGKVTGYQSTSDGLNLTVDVDNISPGATGPFNNWFIVAGGEAAVKSIGVRSMFDSGPMLETDRDLSMVADTNEAITVIDPSLARPGEYKIAQIGAATLTVIGTFYNVGGEVINRTLGDAEVLVFSRFTKEGGAAAWKIDSEGA